MYVFYSFSAPFRNFIFLPFSILKVEKMTSIGMLDLGPRRHEVIKVQPLNRATPPKDVSLEHCASQFVQDQTSAVGIVSQLAVNTPSSGVWPLLRDLLVDADRSTGYNPDALQIEDTPTCRRWYISHYATIQSLLMRNSTLRSMSVIMGWLEQSYSNLDSNWEFITSTRNHQDTVFQCLRAGKPLDALRVAEGAENWPLCCELDRSYMLTHPEAWFENTSHAPLFGELRRGDGGAEWVSNEHRLTHLAALFDDSLDSDTDMGTKIAFATLSGNEEVLDACANFTNWRDHIWCVLRCCLISVFANEVSVVTGDMNWRSTDFHTYVSRRCPSQDVTYTFAISTAVKKIQAICTDVLSRALPEDDAWQVRLIQHSLCSTNLLAGTAPSPLSALLCCALDKASKESLSLTTPQGGEDFTFPNSMCALACELLDQRLAPGHNITTTLNLVARLFDLINDNTAYVHALTSFFCALRSKGKHIDNAVEIYYIDACRESVARRAVGGALRWAIEQHPEYQPRYNCKAVDQLFVGIVTCSAHTAFSLVKDAAVQTLVTLDRSEVVSTVDLVNTWVVAKYNVNPTDHWLFWTRYAQLIQLDAEHSTTTQALATYLKSGRSQNSVACAQKLRDLFDTLYITAQEAIYLGRALAVTSPGCWPAVFHCANVFTFCALSSLCAGSEIPLGKITHHCKLVFEAIAAGIPTQCCPDLKAAISGEVVNLLKGQTDLWDEVSRQKHVMAAAQAKRAVA